MDYELRSFVIPVINSRRGRGQLWLAAWILVASNSGEEESKADALMELLLIILLFFIKK